MLAVDDFPVWLPQLLSGEKSSLSVVARNSRINPQFSQFLKRRCLPGDAYLPASLLPEMFPVSPVAVPFAQTGIAISQFVSSNMEANILSIHHRPQQTTTSPV
jgi:hypothetical protein